MPRPNRFIADQFIEVDQSLAGVDRSGEIRARSLQSLGKGISDLGRGLAAYEQRQAVLDRRRVTDDATNSAMEASQEALDFAKTSPDARPDGSDMVDTFNSGYNEIREIYLDTLSNDEEKEQARLIFERQRLGRTEGLLQEQRQKRLEFTINKNEQSRIRYNGQVLNDPSQFSLALQSVEDSNSAMLEAGLVPPDKIDLLRQKTRKDLVYSAIDGMTLVGQDYNEAILDIIEGRFSQLLTGDEKRKLIGIVQNRKLQAANLSLQESARDRAEDRQLREENQRETFSTLFQTAVGAQDADSREIVFDQVDRAVSSQLLTKADAEYIRSYMSKPRLLSFDDQNRSFQISGDIIDGEDMNEVIKRDVISGAINPATGEKLLQKMADMRTRTSVSGKEVHREKMKLAKEHLNALFGSKTIFDKLPGFETERRLKRNQAGSMLLNRMIENPELDPRQAAMLVGQEIGGMDIRSYPPIAGVPSNKQDTAKELIEQIAVTISKFKAGAMSKEKRSFLILQLNSRIDTIKALEATKAEVSQLTQQIMDRRKQNTTINEEEQQ